MFLLYELLYFMADEGKWVQADLSAVIAHKQPLTPFATAIWELETKI